MKLDAGGLRRRLATALTALSVTAAGLLALAFWSGEEWLERDSLRRLTEHGGAPSHEYLAYSEDLARRRGYWLLLLGAGGTALIGASAWWLSGRVARRSLKPLADLVAQIRAVDLERHPQRLALAVPDPELQVIVSALNQLMAQLDALLQRERAFVAAASHELRTPLAVIGGAASVLAQLPQVPPAVLGRIERAVLHARQDLEALLALSRGAAAAPVRSQRLDQLLPEIAALHIEVHANPATRVHWDVAGPVERELNVGALSIVFGNLLRNALRAAGGGEVRIVLDVGGIGITDSGPGLPPELLRDDALDAPAARRDGGSGMGLYIASVLAQREGWTLRLSSPAGGGARAELRFGS